MKIGDRVIVSKWINTKNQIINQKADIVNIHLGSNSISYQVIICDRSKDNYYSIFLNRIDESIVLESVYLRNMRESKLNQLLNEV